MVNLVVVKLQSGILTLKSDRRIPERPDLLRGFFGSRFRDLKILHHHEEDGLIYRYPLVRYAVIGGRALVIGYIDGVRTIQEIYLKIDKLEIGGSFYHIFEKNLKIQNLEFGISDKKWKYRFISPWLALSQRNYVRFNSLDVENKRKLLSSILIGNILSASKGLGYHVSERIDVELRKVKTLKCSLKGIPVIGFEADFSTRFLLPDLFGLGKSVSRGFGLLKCLDGA
ncbi:hypothetical protein KEJ47_09190 [Candidatus Bathyarchaeota archaeon]|nr:hypothetical protein [Candidatus Bathyarchaeota archaeon]